MMGTIIDKAIVGGMVGGSLALMISIYAYFISKGKNVAESILGVVLFIGLGMGVMLFIATILTATKEPEYLAITIMLGIPAIGIYYFLGDVWSPLNTDEINLKNIKFITLAGAIIISAMIIAFYDGRLFGVVILQNGIYFTDELVQIILSFIPYVLVRVWEASYRK